MDAAEHVTHFPGGDAHPVEAYTVGSGLVGIVLAHQAYANLCEWAAIWPDLTARGYQVMAITMGGAIDTDVVAAVRQLRAQGAQKVVLIGASMGGTAVLSAAAQIDPPVQAVISLSGPEYYGPADAFDKVKTLRVPVAYFAGKQDTVFADQSKRLYDVTAEPDKTLHIYEGEPAHGVDLWSDAKDEVLAFIARHVI